MQTSTSLPRKCTVQDLKVLQPITLQLRLPGPLGYRPLLTLMRPVWELLLLALINLFARATGAKTPLCLPASPFDLGYCLSWRLAVESNNVRRWRTVPPQCIVYVEDYMLRGQYERDINMVVEQIICYMKEISPTGGDGMDAWIFDVDDTCISNLRYYEGKRFGGDPFDPMGFKSWAQRGICPAIPAVLKLYKELIEGGFKVFLITGRDEELLGTCTAKNIYLQGFVGHERLVLRGQEYKGKSAVVFKTAIRKQLEAEGYRIRGNVGDQWTDLAGDCVGDRTFKLPNPMYFVP